LLFVVKVGRDVTERPLDICGGAGDRRLCESGIRRRQTTTDDRDRGRRSGRSL